MAGGGSGTQGEGEGGLLVPPSSGTPPTSSSIHAAPSVPRRPTSQPPPRASFSARADLAVSPRPRDPLLDLRRHAARFSPGDAAIVETFVVPRYLSLFGELALEQILEGYEPQVVHLDCLTGYPDRGVARQLPGAHIYGVDPSQAAIELAKAKAKAMPELVSDYRAWESLPVPLPSAAFSHGLDLTLPAAPEARRQVLEELARLIAPHGQAVVAMPLRGSFLEIFDLIREYAVRHETRHVTAAADMATMMRPTGESLGHELTAAGFEFVDVSMRIVSLAFQNGRDVFEDPVTRLFILPEIREQLGLEDSTSVFTYVRDAIDKYWSDSAFELSVIVGCAVGRRT